MVCRLEEIHKSFDEPEIYTVNINTFKLQGKNYFISLEMVEIKK